VPHGEEIDIVNCITSPSLQPDGARSCRRNLPSKLQKLLIRSSHPLTTLHFTAFKKNTGCAPAVLCLSLNSPHLASRPQNFFFYSEAPLEYLSHRCWSGVVLVTQTSIPNLATLKLFIIQSYNQKMRKTTRLVCGKPWDRRNCQQFTSSSIPI